MVYAGGGVVLNNASHAADPPRAAARFSVHEHADGPRRLPRNRSAVHRHARHARHVRIEHGDAELRRADRRRRALRRPRDRQPGAFLPQPIARSSTSTSIRRRSRSGCKVDVPIVGYVGDVLDEMVKLVESSPQRPDPAALKAWWAEIKEWQRKDCLRYDTHERADQAAVRDREALRAHRRATRSSRPTSASTRCGRRSTTSSTSRGAGSIPAASARWASDCRRRWACSSSIPGRRSSASPAKRRSRCASRSSRPASSITCRSRS